MVERQGWGEIKEGLGAPVRKLLTERRGQCTIVRLASGEELTVYDGGAWGRDFGSMWEHVYARVTPLTDPPRDYDTHLLPLSEVECLLDPESREVLMRQVPEPGQA